MMAGEVDVAANFFLVQLIEQEPGIYDNAIQDPDYARRDKVDIYYKQNL
jgi:hypothetical protein